MTMDTWPDDGPTPPADIGYGMGLLHGALGTLAVLAGLILVAGWMV